MSKLEAVVFDCFGVLYADVGEVYGARFPHLADDIRNLTSANDHGFISRQEYLEGMSKLTGDSPEVIDGVLSQGHTVNGVLIEYIRQEVKPHYKTGMLSNVGRDFMQNFFDENELYNLFDAVVLSSSVGYTKPEPEVYRIMLKQLGVEPGAAVMIDDREINCHGAEVVGMQSILFISFEQTRRKLEQVLGS